MIVDLISWVRDVETAAVTGCNAQLVNVPRDADQPPPAESTFYNAIDHEWVSRGTIPRGVLADDDKDARPIVIIRLHPDPQGFRAQILPEFAQDDPTIIPVVLIYACRKIEKDGTTITIASQVRDGMQTIRTLVRVLAQQFDSSHTAKVRNGVVITLPSSGFILNSEFLEPTDDLVLDTVVAPFKVHDPWALGLS